MYVSVDKVKTGEEVVLGTIILYIYINQKQ